MSSRPWAQDVAFHKVFLALILVVAVARLALSLAGLPDASVRWVSMNVPLWLGTFLCGVAVQPTGFGGYRELLPFHAVALLGIGLAAAGHPNILAAPECGGRASHAPRARSRERGPGRSEPAALGRGGAHPADRTEPGPLAVAR